MRKNSDYGTLLDVDGALPRSLPELNALIDARVRALLLSALDDRPEAYTSHCDGPRPEGWGLRAWQRAAGTIPGAVKRGRYIYVPREAFAAWERGAAIGLATAANDREEWSPKAALAEAGLRNAS